MKYILDGEDEKCSLLKMGRDDEDPAIYSNGSLIAYFNEDGELQLSNGVSQSCGLPLDENGRIIVRK